MVLKIIQLCLNFAKTLTLRSYTLPTSGPNLAFECFWCLGTHWHELVPMKPRGISSMSIAGSFNSHVAEDIRIYQGCQGWRESGACGATRDFSRFAETGCQRRWLRGLSSTHVLMKLTVIQYGFQTHRLWLWTQMRDHSTGLEQCRVFLSCEWFRDWVSCVWYPFCDLSIHIVWLTRAHEKKRSRFMQNRSLERFLNSHLTESYMVSYKLGTRLTGGREEFSTPAMLSICFSADLQWSEHSSPFWIFHAAVPLVKAASSRN